MKRRILNILFIGIIVINFNGCYFDEITCDDETAQELVEEIIMEDVLKAIYTSEMTGNLMNKFKNRVVSPSYAQFKNNAHVDKFVLSSFITTNKNKDLRKEIYVCYKCSKQVQNIGNLNRWHDENSKAKQIVI